MKKPGQNLQDFMKRQQDQLRSQQDQWRRQQEMGAYYEWKKKKDLEAQKINPLGQQKPLRIKVSDATKFAEAEKKAAKIRCANAEKRLSEQQFAAAQKQGMIQDEQGRWWTFGANPREWFRYDGVKWVKAIPPGFLSGLLKR